MSKYQSISAPTKQIIASIITIILIISTYFGIWRPLIKSRTFVAALKQFRSENKMTVEKFLTMFKGPLDYYSPIGQGEITSSYLGNIYNAIAGQKNPEVINALAKEARERSQIVLGLKGFSVGQGLIQLGSIYEVAGINTRNIEYINEAEKTYYLGLTYSNGRKSFLEGLLRIYVVTNQKEKANNIAETIFKFWPNDEWTIEIMKEME